MPSPFPGMDPFLEYPRYFRDLHHSFLVYLSERLNPALPRPYSAEFGKRNLLNPSLPVREFSLEICTCKGDTVVSAIELLNGNIKIPGSIVRTQYLQKQQEYLTRKINFIEIDLIRRGEHTTAIPLSDLREQFGTWDYHVCISQFTCGEERVALPFRLDAPLPTIAIPLLPGDDVFHVDLQKVFDRAYDTGPYYRQVWYTDPVPPPKLTTEQAAWVQKVLAEKGLLSP